MPVSITTRLGKGSRLSTIEVDTNFTNLKAACDTNETDINTLESNVATIQSDLNTAESNITTLQSNVTALQANSSVTEARLADDIVSTQKLKNKAVTFAKQQDISTAVALGRKSAGTGQIEELNIQDLLAFLGNASQGSLLFKGSSGWSIRAPGTAGQYLQTAGAGSDPLWADVTVSGSSSIDGFRNKVINGDFTINQYALTTAVDGGYGFDMFYVLCETGGCGVAKVDFPESGAVSAMRVTQPDGTSKRFGFAHVIESPLIQPFRNSAMAISARIKPSFSGNVRYAILEHTGTADSVTRDVVSNWSSTSYTAGGFFIAGVNVLKTGTIAPGAATYADLSDNVTLGTSTNNIILFIWSESAQAQNATIEVNRLQFEPGVEKTQFNYLPNGTQLALCQRYFVNYIGDSSAAGFAPIAQGVVAGTSHANLVITTPVSMRVTPTLTFSGTVFMYDGVGIGSLISIGNVYKMAGNQLWGTFTSNGSFAAGRACFMYTNNASTHKFSLSAVL